MTKPINETPEQREQRRIRDAEYYIAHREKMLAANKLWRAEHAEEKALKARDYYLTHTEQEKARTANWTLQHKEELPERRKGYHHKTAEQQREYTNQYRASHPELRRKECTKRYALHREQMKASSAKWCSEHPELRRYYGHLYRTLKLTAEGAWYISSELLESRWDYYGRICYLCGAPATATDHVKPLTKGGAEWPCNLRPICRSCNSKKHNKWPFDIAAFRKQIGVTNAW
jgi:5-methylcytosine-specific restriction endonuclease McrA